MSKQFRCPKCQRYLEKDPEGYGDAAYHDPNGCTEFEGDVDGIVPFCSQSCADAFHERTPEDPRG